MKHSKLPWRIVDTKEEEGYSWCETDGTYSVMLKGSEFDEIMANAWYYNTAPTKEDAELIVNNAKRYKDALEAVGVETTERHNRESNNHLVLVDIAVIVQKALNEEQ